MLQIFCSNWTIIYYSHVYFLLLTILLNSVFWDNLQRWKVENYRPNCVFYFCTSLFVLYLTQALKVLEFWSFDSSQKLWTFFYPYYSYVKSFYLNTQTKTKNTKTKKKTPQHSASEKKATTEEKRTPPSQKKSTRPSKNEVILCADEIRKKTREKTKTTLSFLEWTFFNEEEKL